MGAVTENWIEPNQVWVSRNGQRWLVLPNEHYRDDCFRAINQLGEILRFWRSGRVAYRCQASPEDLTVLCENQTLEITPTIGAG